MKKVLFISIITISSHQRSMAQYVNSQGVTIDHYAGPAKGPTHDKPAADNRPLAKPAKSSTGSERSPENSATSVLSAGVYSNEDILAEGVSPERQHVLDSLTVIFNAKRDREEAEIINGRFEDEINADNSFESVFEARMNAYSSAHMHKKIIETYNTLQSYLAKMHYPADTIHRGAFSFTDMQEIMGESCLLTADYKRSIQYYSIFFALKKSDPYFNKEIARNDYINLAKAYTAFYKQDTTRYIDSALVCYERAIGYESNAHPVYYDWRAQIDLQRGLLLIEKADYVTAAEIFTQEIKNREDPETLGYNKVLFKEVINLPFYYYRAVCNFNLKKNKNAAADCKSSMKNHEIIENDKISTLYNQINEVK